MRTYAKLFLQTGVAEPTHVRIKRQQLSVEQQNGDEGILLAVPIPDIDPSNLVSPRMLLQLGASERGEVQERGNIRMIFGSLYGRMRCAGNRIEPFELLVFVLADDERAVLLLLHDVPYVPVKGRDQEVTVGWRVVHILLIKPGFEQVMDDGPPNVV